MKIYVHVVDIFDTRIPPEDSLDILILLHIVRVYVKVYVNICQYMWRYRYMGKKTPICGEKDTPSGRPHRGISTVLDTT